MTKVLSLRVGDDLAEWADTYAASRGVTRQALLEEGLRSFQRDCETGVPEIREVARRQSYAQAKSEAQQGVGVCPERAPGLGHVWKSPRVDPYRSCIHCGLHGREPAVGQGNGGPEGGGYFAAATNERVNLYDGLRAPGSSHGQKR